MYRNRATAIEADQEALDDLAIVSDIAHACGRLARQLRHPALRRDIRIIVLGLVKLKHRAIARRERASAQI